MPQLAIVIPVYKARFLRETLRSISNQVNKDFVVYIGDDASPEDIAGIVKEFDGRFIYRYHRFDINQGRDSLIKQWERCIALVKEEKWVWLFGDDDLMSPTCVSRFYEMLEKEEDNADAYRINTIKINEAGSALKYNNFPLSVNAAAFLEMKVSCMLESYIVEYIFLKERYNELGGIPDFPLGWASDDAFWLQLASPKPIRLITGAMVFWRHSDYNISGNIQGKHANLLKIAACLLFITWFKKNCNAYKSNRNKRLIVKWYAGQLCWLGRNLSPRETLRAFLKCISIYPFQGLVALYPFLRKYLADRGAGR